MTKLRTIDELLAVSSEEREEYIQQAMKINNELVKRTEKIVVLYNVMAFLFGVIGLAVFFVDHVLYGVALLVTAVFVKVFLGMSRIQLDVSILSQNMIIAEHHMFALALRVIKATEEKS